MSVTKTIDIMRSKLNERKRNRCDNEVEALRLFETSKKINVSDFKVKSKLWFYEFFLNYYLIQFIF
jgi:hypothetical protein